MFCSKCGKEINDGAAFCDKCGAKIGSIDNHSRSASSSVSDEMSQDEKVAKTRLLSNYMVYMVLIFFAFIMLMTGDWGIFINSINSINVSGYTPEMDGFVIFLLVAIIICLGCDFIIGCLLPYKNRNFDGAKTRFKYSSIGRSIIPVPIALLFIINYSIEFGVGAYIALGLNIALNILMIVLFNKAAEEESAARYKENHSTSALLKKLGVEDKPERPDASVDWTCKDCGRVNKAIDSYCKDCGKYR